MRRIFRCTAPSVLAAILLAAVLLAALAIIPARAEQLTIDRIFSDPSIDGPLIRALKFSPDGSRVTFLRGKEQDSNHTDLWEFNIAAGESRLLVDSNDLIEGEEKLSHEEILRRTTQRISDQRGIVQYQWSEDGAALLFPLNGDIYYYTLGGEGSGARQLTETEASEFDIQFSPKGAYASFIRGQDLYVIDVASGEEKRLTTDGEGPVKNGVAEYVAQEEINRFTGYWWSGDERYIVFTQIDETPVSQRARYEINGDGARMIEHERYPAAGTANVLIRVAVVEVESGAITWVDIGEETDIYIARVDWLPDSERFAIQRQSRDQKTLDLLLADAKTGATELLLTENSPSWINLHNDLYFLKNKPLFVWSSEASGYRHLYLYDLEGKQVRQLTKGDWAVSSLLEIDEDAGVFYFEGNAGDPLQRHLFRAALEGSAITKISSREGWHGIEIDGTAAFYIDRFSAPGTPPQSSLHRIDGSHITFLEQNTLDDSHPYFPFVADQPITEFGSLKSDNSPELFYRLIKPKDFDPQKKYPILVFVYGGPHAQQVRKVWPGRNSMWLQVAANNGFLVFTLDNRGSFNRGRTFEEPLYRRMGGVEVEDQKKGVEFLATLPYADTSRVGVFGWSYGGFMTLMSMLLEPETFHVGVAVSPVVDWRLYDTHYTERYLGDPNKPGNGYAASSPITYIDNLQGPLLLIHGLADNNVLPQNSTMLAKALQDKDIPFEMMLYPGKRHGIRGLATRRHLFKSVMRYLERNLKNPAN